MDPGTFPRLLVARAQRQGRRGVALREKKYGIWQEITWEQYAAHVRAVALGLVQLGLRRGDRVAVISGNRPQWLYTELAAQSIGAIPLGIVVDALPEQARAILGHSDARFVMVEDQEQVDEILGIRADLPHLERIVVDDTRGLETYGDPMIIALEEVERLGGDLDARQPGSYDELLGRGHPSDVALLAYRSGSSGAPEAATISQHDLLSMAAAVTRIDRVTDTDEIVSFLPFAWVDEQLLSVAIALRAGAAVNFPEEPETLREDLREIGPHVMIAPPGVWETMCAECRAKIADAGWLKRTVARIALDIGERVAERRRAGRPAHAGERWLSRLAHVLAGRTMLDKLGLSRIRYAYTGGAPLGPEIFRFFRAIGLNLTQDPIEGLDAREAPASAGGRR